MSDRDDGGEIKPVKCTECGGWPTLGWLEGQLVLGCDCGFRLVPEDALLDHSHMRAETEWTTVDPD